MSTMRQITSTITLAVLAVVAGLVPATMAFALPPPPDPNNVAPPAIVESGGGTSWTLTYLVIALAVAEAAALIALTIRMTRTGGFRRHGAHMA